MCMSFNYPFDSNLRIMDAKRVAHINKCKQKEYHELQSNQIGG